VLGRSAGSEALRRGARRPSGLPLWRCAQLAFARLRVSGRECDEAAETEAAGSPFEDVLSSERSDAVARAIAALPPLQREALILFEYEDLSLEEIAAVAGIEIGAVKARLHRARETLRRRLAPLLETRETRRCSQ
jgi:RNA polymerase sigma factor (sigma-70 family)